MAASAGRPEVLNLNSSLRYIQDLKELVPNLPFDNCRYPYYREEDHTLRFFFGKMGYRIAGRTDDFENEPAKKQFREMILKFANFRMESDSNKKLVEFADETLSFLETKFYQPELFHVLQSSLQLLQMTFRNNVLLVPQAVANKFNILMPIMQNSMELVINTFVASEQRRQATSGNTAFRFCVFYELLVETSLQRMDSAEVNPKSAKGSPYKRDEESARKLHIPYLIPTLMYNRTLTMLMVNSAMDYPAHRCTTPYPKFVPASCPMDDKSGMFAPVRLHACFEPERWVQAKQAMFDKPRTLETYDEWFYEEDVRATILKQMDSEPFFVSVPRAFLSAHLLAYLVAMHLALWTWKIQRYIKYSNIEDVQFVFQMLHPSIGMNTSLFNHGEVLVSQKESVIEILYSSSSAPASNASGCFHELVSFLIHETTLPMFRSQPKETAEDVDSDEVGQHYMKVVDDFEPFIQEYFTRHVGEKVFRELIHRLPTRETIQEFVDVKCHH